MLPDRIRLLRVSVNGDYAGGLSQESQIVFRYGRDDVSQPAVGAAFPPHQAGRALSAFNLVIFSGVFCVQWGMGLLIDALRAQGWAEPLAFRAAFATLGFTGACAYGWFLWARARGTHNRG